MRAIFYGFDRSGTNALNHNKNTPNGQFYKLLIKRLAIHSNLIMEAVKCSPYKAFLIKNKHETAQS